MIGRTRDFIEFCGKHPFATGLFAILGLAGLLLSIVSFSVDRRDSSESTVRQERIESSVDDIREALASNANQNSDLPQFSGAWSVEAALGVARTVVTNPDEVELNFVNWFPFKFDGKETRVVLTHGFSDTCSACATALSLFVYERVGDTWLLKKHSVDFTMISSSGADTALAELEVWTIGTGRIGIAIPDHFGRGGERNTSIQLFAFVTDELVKILDLHTEEEFVGSGDQQEMIEAGLWYEAKLQITFDRSRESFGFYDIISTFSDTRLDRKVSVRVPFRSNKYEHPTMEKLEHCMNVSPRVEVFSHEYCGAAQ